MNTICSRFAYIFIVSFVLAGLSGCARHPADTHLELAAGLYRGGNDKRADSRIDRAIALEPGRYLTYLSAMRVRAAAGRHEQAGRVGEKLVELATSGKLDRKIPDHEIASLTITVAYEYWQARRISDAARIYEIGLKLDPDNPGLLNDAGYFFADEDVDYKKALRLTRKAVRMNPESGTVIDSFGWAQYKAGDYVAAARTLARAVELEPDSAEIRYHLGAAYAKLGRYVEARVELRKSLIQAPDMNEASRLLNTLQR